MSKLKLSSPFFANNARIPDKFTCKGVNVNPLLEIEGVPENTKSFALIVDDPDAPMKTWVHWVLWNISPSTKKIEENSVPKEAMQGVTDFGENRYGGPCPPSGTHRYFFKLYALNSTLNISKNSKKEDLEKAMQSHILAQTQLIGLYSK